MNTYNSVAHLFVKQEHKKPMSEISKLDLFQDYGIKGDVNSKYFSPRQVLIVDKADIDKYSILPGELRENLVLEIENKADFKPGAKLSFPNGGVIRLTFYCEPCKRLLYLVDSLKNLDQKRGILGVIVQSGIIARNDQVKIEPNYFPALSDVPYERFLALLQKIPHGKVITYKQIINSIGVDRSYYRVLPTYLKKVPDKYPKHRVVDSQGRIISHILQQREHLSNEEIKISSLNNQHLVALSEHEWQNPHMY